MMCSTQADALPSALTVTLPTGVPLPLEIRVHGRGGQGGVTCAKLIAVLYTQMGLHVQTFGDYGSERTGAPVQAYTRVDRLPISNHNKVYQPDHLIVLNEGLIDPSVLLGAKPGGMLLLNTHAGLQTDLDQYANLRLGVIDATSIALEHGIGSSSVVIINTTILGAYARMIGVPLSVLENTFAALGLREDLEAAEQAFDLVRVREPRAGSAQSFASSPTAAASVPVKSISEHRMDSPADLKTGSWSSQAPLYRQQAAPCNIACPAGNDVVGFIQALRKEGAPAAAAILLATQPLPSVCGRVCPAPCMNSCNRLALDGAVNIRSLERWIGDHADLQPAIRTAAPPLRIAIVGGGPAGLSAAWTLACEGHAVKLYDASSRLGGVLHSGIPAYRLPQQALQRDLARILQLGIETQLNCLLGREDLLHLQQEFDAVIVCTGLAAAFDLSVPGRELEGIEQGLEFLARVKQGPVELRGDVLVVGGGNTAMDCARSALRCGAASVRVVCREGDDMPAIAEEIREAEQEGVRIARRCQPVSFGGSRVVASAGIAEVKSGTPDAGGRPGFIVTDNRSTIPCDKVILAIGQRAGLDMLPDDWQIKDARAWKAGMQLNVWFAGDCATGDGTVSAAIGNGRRVALAVLTQLASGRGDVALGASQPVAPAQIRFSHFELAPPHRERQIPPAVRRTGFEEVSLGLAGPEEADRCFSCGHCTHCDICLVYCPEGVISRTPDGYRVDEVFCKGCGMCVAECPRSAIEMQEKNRQGVRS